MSANAMGTKLINKKSGSSGADWTVAHLPSIGQIGAERDEIDVTTLDSPGGANEYEAGQLTAGDCTFEGMMKAKDDEQSIVKMIGLLSSGQVESWEVEYPSGAKWAFTAYIKAFNVAEAAVNGQLKFNGTLRISGMPTFTPKAG